MNTAPAGKPPPNAVMTEFMDPGFCRGDAYHDAYHLAQPYRHPGESRDP